MGLEASHVPCRLETWSEQVSASLQVEHLKIDVISGLGVPPRFTHTLFAHPGVKQAFVMSCSWAMTFIYLFRACF